MNAHPRFALFCILLGIYLLIYIPAPDSVDGQALLTVSTSLWRRGAVDVNVIAYTDWILPPYAGMGRLGVDDALYSKKGITPSLALLPLAALADLLPPLTARAAAMLLNPLVTALTAVIVYTLIRAGGFRPRTAFGVGLLYGIGTLALPYSKTLYGEPLAALLIAYIALRLRWYEADRRAIHALWVGAALGALVGINVAYGAAIPVVLAWLMTQGKALTQRRKDAGTQAKDISKPFASLRPRVLALIPSFMSLRPAAFALIPIVLCGVLLLAFNLARFGSPLESGYRLSEGEGFIHPILLGLFGLFLSPYRGLLWYSPILWLTAAGAWTLLRRTDTRRSAALWLGLAAAVALAFAGWWSWHGGVTWGARFLVPIVPLLTACLAPIVEANVTRRRVRVILLTLAFISVGIGLLGSVYNVFHYVTYLDAQFGTGDSRAIATSYADAVFYTPSLSAIVGHLALLLGGWRLDLLWLRGGIDWAHLLAALGLVGLGLIFLKQRRGDAKTQRKDVIKSLASLRPRVLAFIPVLTVLLIGWRGSSANDDGRLAPLADLQPAGALIAATTAYGDALIDLETRQPVIVLNAPTPADDPRANALLRHVRRANGFLYLLTWQPRDDQNWIERDLWRSAAFVRETTFDGHRLLLFDDQRLTPDLPIGARFGDVTLAAWHAERGTDAVRAALSWSFSAPQPNAAWFVHLIDADGTILAQQDRAPQGGYALPNAWATGSSVTDWLTFPLDAAGLARADGLRIGWVNTLTGERLPAVDSMGKTLDERYIVLRLEGSVE